MSRDYVLGLDLGTASIGWAVLSCNRDGSPVSLLKCGSHLFDAGVEGNVESGKDESLATPRRNARQMRRQHWRRAWRRWRTLRELQRCELLPPAKLDKDAPETIDAYFKALDGGLREKWLATADHRDHQLLPYRLRAAALDQRLEPFELGRALYHLGQRRGFLSNRRSPADENDGVVQTAIGELADKIEASDKGTLGAYLASLDPSEARVRGRWTARQMYADEFDRIWAEQSQYHPSMTDGARAAVRGAIFDQRPLKSQSHLIGRCSILTAERRAPAASRLAQRFRMLQKVNDLQIHGPDNAVDFLSKEQRETLLDSLETRGTTLFTTIRGKKILGLPRGCRFNLEEGGEKSLPGHRTDAALRTVFNGQWEQLSEEDRDRVVEDVLTYEKSHALAKRGREKWGLSRQQADEFAKIHLEEGYSSHSLAALRVLVPRMEEGLQYATARLDEFPDSYTAGEAVEILPAVADALPDLASPAVARALSELRTLVNAIIRRHGLPQHIRVELSRDLKRGRKHRERTYRDNRERQKRRKAAASRILSEFPAMGDPKGRDIEKVILADECGWRCPYTNKGIEMGTLLGHNPQFDIEHIWPHSRSLDNTFFNKTLCYHEENRQRKRNRTPFEAYSQNEDEWQAILQRVGAFKGDAAGAKLKRFQAEEIPEGFVDRHLAENRFISVKATEYLGLLYGGVVDEDGSRRVHATTGGLTAHLRREWHLNAVLSDRDVKNRDDHRHHAVDAVIIALTDTRTVQILQRAAERADDVGRRLFAPVDLPWEDLVDDVRSSVGEIVASHRQQRRASGPLHAESLYSKPLTSGKETEFRIRKELHKLSPAEVDRIVDPAVRDAVVEKLVALGGDKPALAFADRANHPSLKTRDGRLIPIHKVRIRVRVKPRRIGSKATERHVGPTKGSNHHTVIFAKNEPAGKPRWIDVPATMADVYERKRRQDPIVDRTPPDGFSFMYSLARNEFVEMDDADGNRQIYRLLSISKGDLEFRAHWDGRESKAGPDVRVRITNVTAFKKRKARKVFVNYLGEVFDAGG